MSLDSRRILVVGFNERSLSKKRKFHFLRPLKKLETSVVVWTSNLKEITKEINSETFFLVVAYIDCLGGGRFLEMLSECRQENFIAITANHTLLRCNFQNVFSQEDTDALKTEINKKILAFHTTENVFPFQEMSVLCCTA